MPKPNKEDNNITHFNNFSEAREIKDLNNIQVETGFLYERFKEILNRVFSSSKDRIVIDCAIYPPYIENLVQKAVDLKRQGKFNEAIKIYLELITSEKRVFPVLLEYLYKTVLCTGRLDFAYETIVMAENFIKRCWGPNSIYGTWSQEDKRVEFEQIIKKLNLISPNILTTSSILAEQNISNYVKENYNHFNQAYKNLINFISQYSGGAKIVFPLHTYFGGTIHKMIYEYTIICYELSAFFKSRGLLI